MTGLTAYFGILDVGKVKAGDFVVVSGAAGATGSVVGQIAKLKGARVLGIAGSDDKCAWLKNELGFDDAINYKDPKFAANFRKATKSFIDVYFDNVGGEILDLALSRAKEHARFVMCGGISQYNAASGEAQGPKNYLMIVAMRIRMEGFVVFDYASQYGKARKELAQWLAEGKIKRKETIIKGGLKNAEQALVDLYKGVNTGEFIQCAICDFGPVLTMCRQAAGRSDTGERSCRSSGKIVDVGRNSLSPSQCTGCKESMFNMSAFGEVWKSSCINIPMTFVLDKWWNLKQTPPCVGNLATSYTNN